MLTLGLALWRAFGTLLRAQSAAIPGAPPADFDAYVESSMKTFDVPGMAVAIVKDGKALPC